MKNEEKQRKKKEMLSGPGPAPRRGMGEIRKTMKNKEKQAMKNVQKNSGTRA